MDGESGVMVARICGKPADSLVLESGGGVYVCDEHRADFVPHEGLLVGEIPR